MSSSSDQTAPVQRETVIALETDFSRWRTLAQHAQSARTTPACYEMAVAKRGYGAHKTVVYGGATVEEAQRNGQYFKNGSHKKELFDDAIANGYEIYVRVKPFATEQDAFVYEQQMLGTFDYAWNKKDQSNQVVRKAAAAEKIANAASRRVVKLRELSEEDVAKVKQEKQRLRESYAKNAKKEKFDENNNKKPTRLEIARKTPSTLNSIKPRFLTFKAGKQYDATKPLEKQLDMSDELNQLYVAHMKKQNPKRLEAQLTEAEVHRPVTRSQTKKDKPTGEPKKKADGTLDMRYKANKEAVERPKDPPAGRKPAVKAAKKPARAATTDDLPKKADGTPDMRYKANKQTQQPSSASSSSSSTSSPAGPTKADGTPDMRYSSNRTAAESRSAAPAYASSGPTKADGTPDMRYASNRSTSSSYSSYSSYGGGGGGGGGGPMKANGTPDMRYKSNW